MAVKAVNVVHCSGRGNVVDLRQNNAASSSNIIYGKTAHASNGEKITGTLDIRTRTWNDLASNSYNQSQASNTSNTQTKSVNKIIVNKKVVLDLTQDTATSSTVLSGYVFHSSDGRIKAGNLKLANISWNEYDAITK